MTATMLPFPPREPPQQGNGALEIVRDFFDNVYPAAAGCAALPDADYFLAYMAAAGFVIVPLESEP